MLPQESGRKGLPDRLLFQESQRAEAAIGEEGLSGSPSCRRRVANSASSLAGGKRIAQPLPGIPFIRRGLVALHHGKRLLPVRPAAEQLPPEHKIRTRIQDAQQIPEFIDLGLNGRRRPEQQVLGARPDLQHEVEQVVRLLLLLAQPAAPARLVRLVEDDGAVLAFKQVLALVGVVEDQAGGDDGDAKWAAGDVLRPAGLDDVALGIDPHLLRRRPDRARDAELVRQLHLPLQREGRRAEDEHRAVVQQGRKHGAGRQRQRLADTDFVGQQQARLAVGLPVLQEHRHERALPRLELFAAAVDRAFGQGRAGQFIRPSPPRSGSPRGRRRA